jgi:hypothetical protein
MYNPPVRLLTTVFGIRRIIGYSLLEHPEERHGSGFRGAIRRAESKFSQVRPNLEFVHTKILVRLAKLTSPFP